MEKKKLLQLLKDMTIEEKLAQMTQLSPLFLGAESEMDLTGPLGELDISERALPGIGSTLNLFGAKRLKELQDRYLQENRLRIPLMFMADVIHGYQTVFPIPLAMGCSFSEEVFERAAEIAAKESAASGIHLTFSPMADLVRDPRWGRVMESPGEDPFLNSVMTAATVRGYQGGDPAKQGRLASCVKHFAGYGASEGGRDYNTVDISDGLFRDFYLPAYQAAVDAGAAMVMTSFNTVNRVPASANKTLMRDILRGEWGFTGAVISDYAAVDETISHGIARDGKEAAKKCLEAGVDIEMMSAHYLNYGKQLVEEDDLTEHLIDQAVLRILELKNALGLFENPYKDADEEMESKLHLCAEHRKAAREIARQCAVLLKNDHGVLPFGKNVTVGLAGPFAESGNILGGWAGFGGGVDGLAKAITANIPTATVVTAMTGEVGAAGSGAGEVPDQVSQACDTLRGCDVIVAAVGENPADSGEAASKTVLRLSPNQEKLVRELRKLGKPLALVVCSGRPMEIEPVVGDADAVLQAWFLGTESGSALCDILFGDYNPSGRLSMSIPHTVGQIPVYYNSYQTGRPYSGQEDHYVSKYLDCPNEALFCFGYGLSYSNFRYNAFTVEEQADGTVMALVTVENCSARAGTETVQLYIRDVTASVVRPVKELKGFRQVKLKPGEKRRISFCITHDMLMFTNNQGEYTFEDGEFDIMIGSNSRDVESKRIWIGLGSSD